MKLNRTQIAAVRRQIGLAPLPDEVSTDSGLAGLFGDQTFYVDPEGVYVFERIAQPAGDEPLMAIQIAEVHPAETEGEVVVHPVEPRTTSLTVDLAA